MRCAVREVAKCFPTAIISGRSRDKPGFNSCRCMAPSKQHNNTQHIMVDDKGSDDVAIFRPAQDFLPGITKDYKKVEEKVIAVLAKHSRFHLTRGKKVMEIRPSIEWNKGNALGYLLETLGLNEDVYPLCIGDDRTDEDAFKVIRSRGQGFPIIVTSKAPELPTLFVTPRKSCLSYRAQQDGDGT